MTAVLALSRHPERIQGLLHGLGRHQAKALCQGVDGPLHFSVHGFGSELQPRKLDFRFRCRLLARDDRRLCLPNKLQDSVCTLAQGLELHRGEAGRGESCPAHTNDLGLGIGHSGGNALDGLLLGSSASLASLLLDLVQVPLRLLQPCKEGFQLLVLEALRRRQPLLRCRCPGRQLPLDFGDTLRLLLSEGAVGGPIYGSRCDLLDLVLGFL
mmetsp:Transcript_115446/g.246740  ORF Transcript_115446/g.246740 Transcript_115446/m.246740 type:complete len:212 (+) Transcript_115446:123-758(+)